MTPQVQTMPAATTPPVVNTPSDRLQRGGGWWTLLLALVVLVAVTESLNTAQWSDGLEVVRLAVLGGGLLGFALALTRWDGFFTAVYGILASVVWICTLFNQLIFANLSAREGVVELLTRNARWIAALTQGNSGADNLIFVTQLAVLGWWIGFLALWNLFRHQRVLLAVIPAGVALLVNAYYATRGMTGYLVMYLAAALLLAIRIELARNEARWQVTRVRYAPDITLDFLKSGLAFTIIVMSLTWLAPDLTQSVTLERLLRPFEGPWQKVEDTWNRMYKSLNYARTAQPTSFGKSMTLGGPVNLTDRPIFEAESPERTHWRAVSYDRYSGQGWDNTAPDVEVIDANEPLGEPLLSARVEMTTTIKPLEPGQELIFAPPQPVRVGVPVNADFITAAAPDATDTAERSISLLRNRLRLGEGEMYTVVSGRSEADRDRLRADSTAYPDWIKERYLQLPDDLPDRVAGLAAQITFGLENPYDKAEAIESVLRTYTYNQQIAAPPAGRDGVDYFLFDVKEGYCDYYASSFVVMLRAMGVPARFVVGYTPGEALPSPENDPDPDLVSYRVLERNAHAWGEVYFPSYGWIQFEPTASEPLLVRPLPPPTDELDAGLTPDDAPQPDLTDDLLPEDEPISQPTEANTITPFQRWLRDHWGWFAGALTLAAALSGAAVFMRQRRIRLFNDSAVLARLFSVLGMWAGRLHIPWRPSQTPLEKAASFNARLPEAAPAVDTLAGLFSAQQYGRQQPAAETLNTLADDWEKLQPNLWRRWIAWQVKGPDKEEPTGK